MNSENDPLALFTQWFAEAGRTEINDPNACALATVGEDGWPQVRVVLMKQFDSRGFVIYTNLESVKGQAMRANPRACLNFHWKSLRRQVRITGAVTQVSDNEADAYFATRPRESQLSAWASLQSQPLEQREMFERRLAEFGECFAGPVPRPPHWSGLRVCPATIEFWEDREGRQHHRQRFSRDGSAWAHTLLYP